MKDRLCYHGTIKQNAAMITKQGFARHTFFAKHLEDALGYGGEYIFVVAFDSKKLPDGWQFITRSKISPNKIVEHYRLKKHAISKNEKLRNKVLMCNLTPKER